MQATISHRLTLTQKPAVQNLVNLVPLVVLPMLTQTVKEPALARGELRRRIAQSPICTKAKNEKNKILNFKF